MDRGADWGYLPDPAKPISIAENLEDKEAARRELEKAELKINYVGGSQ